MKVQYYILTCLLLSFYLTNAQHVYCSKYKNATSENRLMLDDFRSDSIDILHTSIELNIPNVEVSNLEGLAELTFRAKLNNVTRFQLDFEGLIVDSVVGNNLLNFIHDDSFLIVEFTQELSLNTNDSISIYYHGSPIKDVTGWGGFYFSGGFAWNLGVGFGADPHSYGRVWFPCFDNFIERSTFEFKVTTQADKMASCNGLLISNITNADGTKTYHWRLEQPIPSYLACVAIGSYEELNDQVVGANGPIPIQLFGRAIDTSNMRSSFQNLPGAILKFEEAFGKYRFDKVGYSLVPFNSGAMEHATNITYPIYAANGTLGNENLMAHELGHMWWGDNVTCQTDGDMWINEGWASFSAYLFQEAIYGRAAYENAIMEDLRYMLQFGHHFEGSYRSVAGQTHDLVYGDHVYKKGALVAHNLRGYMGDELFFETIESFMEKYKYSAVSSDTLEKYFSQSSGIDLIPYFRDWIFSGGYNVLVIDSFKSETNGGVFDVTLFFQQKLKGRTDFHDNVPVTFELKDKNGNTQFGEGELSGRYASLHVETLFDPEFALIYPRNEQAQARTRDSLHILSAGSFDLKNMMWNVNVTTVNTPAEIVFDHIWSAPDPLKNWAIKPIRLSNYHYWKVHGLNINEVEMNAEFFYNGKIGGNSGYLDMDLVSETEDSLKLFYRANSSEDWEEYSHYSRNFIGSSTDAVGLIKLSSVKSGEYVLGNVDHSALYISESIFDKVKIFPNPTKDTITISQQLFDSIILRIIDIHGKQVFQGNISRGEESISITNLPKGQYLIQLLEGQTIVSNQKILKN